MVEPVEPELVEPVELVLEVVEVPVVDDVEPVLLVELVPVVDDVVLVELVVPVELVPVVVVVELDVGCPVVPELLVADVALVPVVPVVLPAPVVLPEAMWPDEPLEPWLPEEPELEPRFVAFVPPQPAHRSAASAAARAELLRVMAFPGRWARASGTAASPSITPGDAARHLEVPVRDFFYDQVVKGPSSFKVAPISRSVRGRTCAESKTDTTRPIGRLRAAERRPAQA